jgi:two-component system, OmpR family, response regulator CpxR
VVSPKRVPPRKTILCIDDEQTALWLRALILEFAGYRVLSATTAEEGLALFRSESVALVITDNLLAGTTGTAAACEMKSLKPEVPILILSGAPERPKEADIADLFLTKGQCEPEQLLQHVAKLVK